MTTIDRKARAVSDNVRRASGRSEQSILDINASGVMVGTVLRAGVGSYDFLVSVGKGDTLQCTTLSRTSNMPFGYSEAFVPCEGSSVLVVKDADGTRTGYIIGVVPGAKMYNEKEGASNDTQTETVQATTFADGPSSDSEQIYKVPLENKNDKSQYNGLFRPYDVFPGDYVVLNEHGVGLDGDMLAMRIRGGNAHVEASRIDDTVEIVCRSFRFYGAQWVHTSFTDAGCMTSEGVMSVYVGERTGGTGLEIAKEPEDPDSDNSNTEGNSADNDKAKNKKHPEGKFRLRTFIGYLGGLISVFLSKPDKNDEKTDEIRHTDDVEPKDNGLMQFNMNENGRVMFRSAGGFVLERSDRIPVPVRIHDYDSPNGIKAEDIDKKDILSFELPEDVDGERSPHYTQLVLSDKLAYDYKQTYDRFIEHIESMAKGSSESGKSGESDENKESEESEGGKGDDFYLRNENDLDNLTNDAGIPDRKISPDDLESNTGRRSGIYNLPSGEIIIRDAWGSEIIMTAGNIVFNTPGTIKFNPGHSFITQAGDDIVLKARNSIDIDATEHDVSVKGERNVRIVGGSDQTTDAGGVLIESLSTSTELTNPKDAQGEDAVSTGIMLKASNSHVSVIGDKTILGSYGETRFITGGGADGQKTGKITFAAGSISAVTSDGVMLSCKDSGIAIADETIAAMGGSVILGGSNGVMFVAEGSIGVPIWVEMQSDYINPYRKQFKTYYEIENKSDADKPVNMEDLLMTTMFTYRSSEQCNTLKGLELTDTPKNYTEYKPYWTVLSDLQVGTMAKTKTEAWVQKTVGGEYPWPGSDAYDKGRYAYLDTDTEEGTYNQMKKEVNIKKSGSDEEKSGEGVDDNSEGETMTVLCSKEYDKIEGSEESDTKPIVSFKTLEEYCVPVIEDEEDEDDSGDDSEESGGGGGGEEQSSSQESTKRRKRPKEAIYEQVHTGVGVVTRRG